MKDDNEVKNSSLDFYSTNKFVKDFENYKKRLLFKLTQAKVKKTVEQKVYLYMKHSTPGN